MFCRNCGNNCDDRFCTNCGEELFDVRESPATSPLRPPPADERTPPAAPPILPPPLPVYPSVSYEAAPRRSKLPMLSALVIGGGLLLAAAITFALVAMKPWGNAPGGYSSDISHTNNTGTLSSLHMDVVSVSPDAPPRENPLNAMMLTYFEDIIPYAASCEVDSVIYTASYSSLHSLATLTATAPVVSEMKLCVEIPGFTQKLEKTVTVTPLGIYMPVLPALLDDALENLATLQTAQLEISLTENATGRVVLSVIKTVTLQPIDDVPRIIPPP